MAVLGVSGVRPLSSYPEFANEQKRYVRADVGALRALVRNGLRFGWCSRITRERTSMGSGVLAWVVRAEVNSAGDCASPVVAHLRGVPVPLPGSHFPAGVRAYLVTVLRRCRQCEWCRMMRSSHWAHRARTEYDRAAVTWMGTVTLTPFNHARLDALVQRKAAETGASWMTDWSEKDRFRERCEVMGALISKWIKRFRQAEVRRRRAEAMKHVFIVPGVSNSRRCRFSYAAFRAVPAKFNYLLVAEEHKTALVGRPHYHILIHEARQYELVRPHEYYVTQKGVVRVEDSAIVRKQWPLGFTQFERCADSRAASYLCKYLSKDMQWRVRASIGYGEDLFGGGDLGPSAPGIGSQIPRPGAQPPRDSERSEQRGQAVANRVTP